MNMVENKMDKKSAPTIKAGCILVDEKNKKIGIIYRDYRNDYEFAKGHLEKGETLQECAIRETAEETKIDAEIVSEIEPFIENYKTPNGELCKTYLFVARAICKSQNTSTDTHELIWLDTKDIEEKLSYENLKKLWKDARVAIKNYFKF